MIFLLPRLPAPAADRLLDQILDGGEFRWPGLVVESLPDCVRYAATGGSTIAAARLGQLRAGLLEVASRHGFPGTGNRDALARFDAALAGWMASVEELGTGEALRDDVWAFFGVVLAPDVVNWRFGGARERYLGGVRNTFQRVWMRAVALDRGQTHPERWDLLEQLTEDALVQITERPAIGEATGRSSGPSREVPHFPLAQTAGCGCQGIDSHPERSADELPRGLSGSCTGPDPDG